MNNTVGSLPLAKNALHSLTIIVQPTKERKKLGLKRAILLGLHL